MKMILNWIPDDTDVDPNGSPDADTILASFRKVAGQSMEATVTLDGPVVILDGYAIHRAPWFTLK